METFAEHSYSKGCVNIKNEPYSEEYSLIVSSEDDSLLSSDADVNNFPFKLDLSAQEDFKNISERSDLTPLDDEIKIEIEENLDFIKQEPLDSYTTDDDVDVTEDFKEDLHFNLFNRNGINNQLDGKLPAVKSNGCTLKTNSLVQNVESNSKTDEITEEHEVELELSIKDDYIKRNDLLNDLNETVQIKAEQDEAPSINFNGNQNLEENASDLHSELIINDVKPTISKSEAYILDYKQALTMRSVCQRTAVNDMIDVGTENELSNSTSGLSMENELKNFTTKAFYKCEHCNYDSRSKFHLRRHLLMHKGVRRFQCDCGYTTMDLSNFQRHIRIHTQERPFKCTKCPYRAINGQQVKLHYMAKHTDIRPFKCTKCPYRATKGHRVKTHYMAKHTDMRPFKCTKCPYRATNGPQVKMHYMAKHTDIRPFKCDLCGFKSVTRQALQNHSATHDKKYMPQPSYKCYRCNFVSHSLKLVKAHINTHSKNYNCIAVTSQDDGDNSNLCTVQTFKCATCSYRTADKEAVHEHIAAHSNKLLRCSECSYQTFYKARYQAHIAKHAEKII